ncbi:hypothetical protein K0B96_12735 [Horticoccus luteus]|uniref:Uncharacterized protein n=1 Tax=Horticoccus luteus TaxID=2862869 RepID=A0A8F9TUT8_9BACT|nr:hypothetical protein [Horticoccus luteus]QYM78169.1 hypothetical protein K0B96_12735 [Horticoccus luteus]
MNFNEAMARRRSREKGRESCYLSDGNARVLALEWRRGKRRILSWSRFNEATLEDGELVLSFVGREVVIHGLNLGELADAIEENRLAKIWEQRAEYQPPPGADCPSINAVETWVWDDESDSGGTFFQVSCTPPEKCASGGRHSKKSERNQRFEESYCTGDIHIRFRRLN